MGPKLTVSRGSGRWGACSRRRLFLRFYVPFHCWEKLYDKNSTLWMLLSIFEPGSETFGMSRSKIAPLSATPIPAHRTLKGRCIQKLTALHRHTARGHDNKKRSIN